MASSGTGAANAGLVGAVASVGEEACMPIIELAVRLAIENSVFDVISRW